MLDALAALPEDPIWGLTSAFRADPRAHKIDMVIGVYRDDHGATPNMKAVRMAERALAQDSAPKTYRALAGNAVFNAGMARLVLGDAPARIARSHVIQTVGGTGALRVLGDMLASLRPDTTVWSTDPGYVNHRPIFEGAGLTLQLYRWQAKGDALDLDRVLADLAAAKPGDVVLLHGCCHNPTGIDPDADMWQALARFCAARGLIPLIDIAYQGFGRGLDADAAGLRVMVDAVPVAMVAASGSKNMGLYCERIGAAMVLGPDAASIAHVGRHLETLTRANYSMPPEHGAAVACHVFDTRTIWEEELNSMRARVQSLRQQLADALAAIGAPPAFQALRHHQGMFSLLPLAPDQMESLRRDHAIYGTATGRINIAGLRSTQIEQVAAALRDVSQA